LLAERLQNHKARESKASFLEHRIV
jgi:hypothetical protein